MARRNKRGRSVDGVLLLDKPRGLTSNQALQAVKRLFGAAKAGHTGSLDPLATGLLPICLGEATKLSAFLLEADKSYQTVCRLGTVTTTGDGEGEVVSSSAVPNLTRQDIEAALAKYRGAITQIPPMHSAIKVNGRPLYELAHQGKEIERQPREVTVHQLEFVEFNSPDLHFAVRCSKGTYIRTLAEDIGRDLGCGGHVAGLRRTEVGGFSLDQAHTLEQLEMLATSGNEALDAVLLPVESALTLWPSLQVSNDMAFFLSRGQAVQVPDAPRSGWVKIFRGDQRFLGVGEILDDGRVSPRRLFRLSA